jgi:hypothetical protein
VGWVVGAVFLGVVPFFYRLSGRAAELEARGARQDEETRASL